MDGLRVISQPVMLRGRQQSWSKGFPVKLAESEVPVWEVLEMDGGDSLTHQKGVNAVPWVEYLLHKCEDLSSDPQDTHKARGGRQKSPQKLKGQVSEAHKGTNKRPCLKQDGR